MKHKNRFSLPSDDDHAIRQMEDVRDDRLYQQWKIEQALRYTKLRRTAIDIGCHVGLISYQLASKFKLVYGFEANSSLRPYFESNLKDFNNTVLHSVALGNKMDRVSLNLDGKATLLTSIDEKKGPVKLFPLDSFSFEKVDFVKIDVEGYEAKVIEGAKETLRMNDPVILVEHKGYEGAYNEDGEYLESLLSTLGFSKRKEVNKDFIYTKDTLCVRPSNFDPEKPVAIVGGGPSAATVDFKELCEKANVIAVNDSIKKIKKPLCFFTLDGTYFNRYRDALFGFKGPAYIALPAERFRELKLDRYPNAIRLDRIKTNNGFPMDQLSINGGEGNSATSGRGALNLAWLWRTKLPIILIGFDNGRIDSNGPTHWNRQSNANRWTPDQTRAIAETYSACLPQLKATGTVVLNASNKSSLTCFPKVRLEDVL